jgi:hypothetical protein
LALRVLKWQDAVGICILNSIICALRRILFTLSKSKGITWAGPVARMGKMIAYGILVGNPEGKVAFG